MDDGFLTIGPFSRASLVSIKALRSYHEAGILVPAMVDPRTGYREYDVGQLAEPGRHTSVHVRDEPARHTLALAGTCREEDFAAFLGRAYPTLAAAAVAAGAVPAGPSGALYPPSVPDEVSAVVAYLPITAPVALPEQTAGVTMGEVPAARVAVLVHARPYETLDVAYRTLGAWVARFAQPSGDWVREVYLSDPSTTSDPAAYRTGICWPITVNSS